MKVALLTIFYNPEDSDLISFIELSKSFQGKFCFINSLINKKSIDLLKSHNIQIHGDGSNVGISRAYNFILNKCISSNFNLCFISDQDSRFERIIVERFIKSSIKMFQNDEYISITSMTPCFKNNYKKNITENYSYKEFVINSGALISCELWKKIGKYDENLFIDMVDYDFCKRIKKSGLKIINYHDFQFKHSIGKEYKYFFNLLSYRSYNYKRHYFMIKDKFYFLRKKHHKKNFINNIKLLIKIYLKLLKHILLILIFEKNKILCLIATKNGFKDFLFFYS